jgi:vacuolar-type H+-ATPase subunit H
VTIAPVDPQDLVLYGPDGQALTSNPPAGDWQPVRTTDNAVVWERPRQTATLERVIDNQVEQARAEAAAVLSDAQTEASQIVADAHAEADRIAAETGSLRARTLAAADHEAKTIRDTAAAEAEQKKERGKKVDVWMARAVIAGAVGLTATGEYSLARLAHFPKEVAWLLPFVIDIYVIQAFRRHRDILQAIGLTIAANVVYHLAAAGMFGVITDAKGEHRATWWLIAMVASIASVILWRMHVITAPSKPRRGSAAVTAEAAPTAKSVTADAATSAPAPVAAEAPVGDSPEAPLPDSPVLPSPPLSAATEEPAGGSLVAAENSTAKPRVSRRELRGSRRVSAPRDSVPARSVGSDSDLQVAALVTLMRRRGRAEAVTLPDAKKACPGVSERTAARRLEAARIQYAKAAK